MYSGYCYAIKECLLSPLLYSIAVFIANSFCVCICEVLIPSSLVDVVHLIGNTIAVICLWGGAASEHFLECGSTDNNHFSWSISGYTTLLLHVALLGVML